MRIPDRVRLPLAFDPVGLRRDLEHAASSKGWRRHFSRDVYEGDWSVIALRAPAYASHPSQEIYADPFAAEFKDMPVLGECPHIREIIAAFDAPVRGVRLMRLGAGGVIKEHSDGETEFERGLARIHIPIVTNPDVDFRLNGARLDLEPGTAWLLKVSAPHSVANRGTTDRVHLVVDVSVNDWMRALVQSGIPEVDETMEVDDAPLVDVPVLETQRLKLRAFRRSDFAHIFELWSDPRTVHLMGMKPMTEEEAWGKFLRGVGSWVVNGFGMWVAEEKATGRFLGELGFIAAKRALEPSIHAYPEVGWSFMPEVHGQGFASEAVGTALTWGQLHFGRTRFAAIIAPENEPSLKLARKFGFVEAARSTYKNHPTIVLFRD